MKRNLLILLSLLALPVIADDVVFKAQAPGQVVAGEPFQLVYTINQRGRDLRAPEFTDFEELAGPYEAESSSFSFVNGHRTSSYEKRYTFMIVAKREGTYTIAPATIRVNGNTIQSNGVRIQVLPEEQPSDNSNSSNVSPNNGQANPTNQNNQGSHSSQGSSSITADNLFVRTIVSKTKVREQEAVLLTYKLYFANVDVAQMTNNIKLPELTGFLKQSLEQGEIQTELEHYNGRNYKTAVLYRYILYPQHSGDIRIEPASFEFILRVQTRQQVRSIFSGFMDSYTNVPRTLTAPATTIHVSALPSGKPAGFSGGVGKFKMTPSISQTELQTNDAVTIRMDISGSGNMKLLKTPAVDWPEGFEPYDPKVTNNFNTTAAGMSGTKSIEYLAIPRNSGTYTIPPIRFSYFDTDENKYQTLSTPEYIIHVKRSAGEQVSSDGSSSANSGAVYYAHKEDIKQLGTDIRYIDTKPLKTNVRRKAIIDYRFIWLWYVLPALAAILLLIILRKQIRENADAARVRYKRANKVAQRRLKAASAALKANEKDRFYEEIERAAWTYLSDRLSIPTAELNKDNIATLLRQKGVNETLISDVNHVLSTAEFARYAPSDAHEMDDLYRSTTQLINQLEEQKV